MFQKQLFGLLTYSLIDTKKNPITVQKINKSANPLEMADMEY